MSGCTLASICLCISLLLFTSECSHNICRPDKKTDQKYMSPLRATMVDSHVELVEEYLAGLSDDHKSGDIEILDGNQMIGTAKLHKGKAITAKLSNGLVIIRFMLPDCPKCHGKKYHYASYFSEEGANFKVN